MARVVMTTAALPSGTTFLLCGDDHTPGVVWYSIVWFGVVRYAVLCYGMD